MTQPQENDTFASKHAVILDGGDQTPLLVTALLEEMEFGSITKLTDQEAILNITSHKHLDLLILDLDAAGDGGNAFVLKALENDPELTIVVVSSYATIEQSVDLMKRGVMDVVRKPLDLGTMKNKIAALMRSTPARPDKEGNLVIADYEVIREIERGGMGIIYRARDTRDDSIVALKVLKTGRNAPIEQVLRFHREASAVAKLAHPYIVKVINTGFSGEDYFIAMEFVDGRSLDEAVYEDDLSPLRCVDIMVKILEAMEYAHGMNIIHRDLKPPNILLDAVYDPHIIDFGLATYVKGNIRLTKTGIVMGTIGYIAPERIRGGITDERVDIFSCGAILYESLTKKIPYETDSRVISVPTTYDDLVPLRTFHAGIPAELDTVCARALAVDPDMRYRTATQFREELVKARDRL